MSKHTPPECGCKWGHGEMCPLHEAAPDLLEALMNVSVELEDRSDAEGNSAADWQPNWAMRLQQEVDQAIAKAEGEK